MNSSHEDDRLNAEATDAEEAPVVDAEVIEEESVEGDVADVGGAEVEQDLADLVEQARSERDEYLDLAQRTKADFDNYRKRMAVETASSKVRGQLDVVAGVINAIDNLERTMAAENIDPAVALSGEMPSGAAVALQGVIVAYRDLHSTLRAVSVEVFNPTGDAFDPNLHEALQAVPSEKGPPGVVLEVMQLGYRSGETVIRPARVVVSQ